MIRYYYNLLKKIRRDFMIEVISSDLGLEDAYRLRYEIYCLEKKYLDKELFPERMESDIYDGMAIHFIMRDRLTNLIVGYVRLINGENFILPLEKEFESVDLKIIGNRSKLCEVSRLVIREDYRKNKLGSHVVLYGLLATMLDYCLVNKIDYLTAAIDDTVLIILKKIGVPFTLVGESREYVGSSSTYTLIDISREWNMKNIKFFFLTTALRVFNKIL